MKVNFSLVLFLACMPVCCAALADAEEAADGYLTTGEYDGSPVELEGFEQLFVMGGGAGWISTKNESYLKVEYTSTPLSNSSGIYDIVLYDESKLLYLGGITQEITIRDNATAHLKGGRIDGITLYDHPNYSHEAIIYCQPGYQMSQSGIIGLWQNGDSFDIHFVDVGSPYPPTWQGITIIEVPEPATLALLGLGGLLLRRKQQI